MVAVSRFLRGAVAAALAAATASFAASSTPSMSLGGQCRWSLDFRTSLAQSAAAPVEVHLTGVWTSTIVAMRPGEYDAQLQITDIGFTGDAAQNAPAATLKDLQSRLARPFWATYRSDGGLLAIHFFRDVTPTDRNLLQMIATELQIVQPNSERPSWTAQERDGAGEYVALYVMLQRGHILKRKLKYVYIDGAAGGPANAVSIGIDESSVSFSVAPNGHVLSVDGTSRMHISLNLEKSQQLTIVADIHIGDLRTERAPELIGSLAHALPNVTNSPIVTHRMDPDEVRPV